MACYNHHQAPVSINTVPIEVYSMGGTPLYSIPSAQMETCTQCGSRYYNELDTQKLPHGDLKESEPQPQINTWDC